MELGCRGEPGRLGISLILRRRGDVMENVEALRKRSLRNRGDPRYGPIVSER
jgi:ribosomal protein L13E